MRKIFPVFPGAHITNFSILIYLKFSSPKSSTTHSLFDFLFVISEPNKYKNSHCHWFWCLSTRRSQFIESLLWVSVELTHTFLVLDTMKIMSDRRHCVFYYLWNLKIRQLPWNSKLHWKLKYWFTLLLSWKLKLYRCRVKLQTEWLGRGNLD